MTHGEHKNGHVWANNSGTILNRSKKVCQIPEIYALWPKSVNVLTMSKKLDPWYVAGTI